MSNADADRERELAKTARYMAVVTELHEGVLAWLEAVEQPLTNPDGFAAHVRLRRAARAFRDAREDLNRGSK